LRPDARAARRELRRRIRAERRALSATERKAAVNINTSRILGLGAFVSARRVAVFISFDGEPSLSGLVSAAVRQRKTVYAPVITRSHMEFAELHPDAGLATNFFGISEPDRARTIDPRRLDLVLTPLVAFDDAGAAGTTTAASSSCAGADRGIGQSSWVLRTSCSTCSTCRRSRGTCRSGAS
jgi:5-formyltetrahydrofolate cyclo-ligase